MVQTSKQQPVQHFGDLCVQERAIGSESELLTQVCNTTFPQHIFKHQSRHSYRELNVKRMAGSDERSNV